jgi:hypothetical protein
MAQRRHHYERAFEEYLRTRRIPYVAVDEARKALLPENAPLRISVCTTEPTDGTATALKSFDFVIYGWDWSGRATPGESNLLLDVKGRRVVAARRRKDAPAGSAAGNPPVRDESPESARRSLAGKRRLGVGRLESWVTREDIESLSHWASLFGPGFDPAFVFVYWCDDQPPDALFQEVFEFQGRWYALRGVRLSDYVDAMKPRSLRWRTVHVPTGAFERISRPFARR